MLKDGLSTIEILRQKHRNIFKKSAQRHINKGLGPYHQKVPRLNMKSGETRHNDIQSEKDMRLELKKRISEELNYETNSDVSLINSRCVRKTNKSETIARLTLWLSTDFDSDFHGIYLDIDPVDESEGMNGINRCNDPNFDGNTILLYRITIKKSDQSNIMRKRHNHKNYIEKYNTNGDIVKSETNNNGLYTFMITGREYYRKRVVKRNNKMGMKANYLHYGVHANEIKMVPLVKKRNSLVTVPVYTNMDLSKIFDRMIENYEDRMIEYFDKTGYDVSNND